VIANQLYAAIVGGANADSIRSLHRALIARAERDPASETSASASLLALVQRLEVEKRRAMADVVRALINPSP
jgi:hypothetical protein